VPETPARLWLRPPRWSPAVVGIATALAVVLLWRGLVAREHAQLATRARIAADASRRAVDRQFATIRAAVERTVTFSSSAGPGTEQFGSTVDQLIAETDGLARLMLVDTNGVARRASPRNVRPTVSPTLRRVVRETIAAGDSSARIVALTDAASGIAIVRHVRSRVDGDVAAVGLVDERTLLREFTADTAAGFAIHAFVADSELVGDPVTAEPPTLVSDLRFGDRVITLTLTARDGARPSQWPTFVLALGLTIAALLSLTLWLARKTYDAASAVGVSRVQRAIERPTDGVWELEWPSRRTYRSKTLLRSLGLDPDEVNGSSTAWTMRIHPEDAGRVQDALARHVAGDTESFESEYRVRAGDGSWHTLVDRGRVIDRTVDGRALRVLGISADTTEQERAQAARDESERRFRAMFESAHQLQLLLDLQGRILEANGAATTVSGVAIDRLQQCGFAELSWWRADDAALVQDRVARAAQGESSRFEVEMTDHTGRVLFVDFSLKPVRDETQHVVQVLAEGRDVTERKRSEASLREIGALTTMGQLAARVAHDINNPLAGIQNAFLLVRGAIPDDHPHHPFVGAIEREIARIAAVTRQLYETYRPDQAMVTSSSVILAAGDAVRFLEQVNRARSVRIVTDLTGAPSTVPVPDALIRQALYTLVQNAVDASPAGGVITVTAAHIDDWCEIRVTDEGPGIPDALHQRIFDPFFSTKDRSVKTGGMGIGLSLVHQSVTAVGGDVAVYNRESGGSEFRVRLPMTPIDTGVLR